MPAKGFPGIQARDNNPDRIQKNKETFPCLLNP
jgi:hypothetical protein